LNLDNSGLILKHRELITSSSGSHNGAAYELSVLIKVYLVEVKRNAFQGWRSEDDRICLLFSQASADQAIFRKVLDILYCESLHGSIERYDKFSEGIFRGLLGKPLFPVPVPGNLSYKQVEEQFNRFMFAIPKFNVPSIQYLCECIEKLLTLYYHEQRASEEDCQAALAPAQAQGAEDADTPLCL